MRNAMRLCAVLLAAAAGSAFAVAPQRTFVASNGNDANPCSLTLPCRGFAAAVAAVANAGEIVVLDSAGYGPFAINKSVTVTAPGGVYAGISVFTGNDGILINTPGIVVALRGLTINGQGGNAGIKFLQGDRLRVESCIVSLLAGSGIVHNAPGAELIVLDSVVRDNGGTGISMNADASLLVDRVRVEHNGGDGIYVAGANSPVATIRNSVLSFNGAGGLAAAAPGNSSGNTSVTVEGCALAQNAGDGAFIGGASGGRTWVSLRRNSFHRNGLSNISAYGTASTANVDVLVSENDFHGAGTAAIKADGSSVIVTSSRNAHTQESIPMFYTANGAGQYTYKDNIGNYSVIGPVPSSTPYF